MRAVVTGVFLSVLFVLLTCIRFSHATEEMMPVVGAGKAEMVMAVNDSRRKLGSFQICALCTCCGGGSKSYCLATPCCYAIDCNIPNRPFGFCSFTPKTCNCFGCHV